MARPNPILFGLGLLVGIGGALYFRYSDAPPVPEPTPEVSIPAPAPIPQPVPAYDPANPSAREEAIRATRLPSEVSYPIQQKYREPIPSPVPHELIAAYDDAGDISRMGRRRLFILTVPPDTSRDDIATLVSNLRAAHLDAEALRIDIFDSKAAATHPAQAGIPQDPHLAASYFRDGTKVTYNLLGHPSTATP